MLSVEFAETTENPFKIRAENASLRRFCPRIIFRTNVSGYWSVSVSVGQRETVSLWAQLKFSALPIDVCKPTDDNLHTLLAFPQKRCQLAPVHEHTHTLAASRRVTASECVEWKNILSTHRRSYVRHSRRRNVCAEFGGDWRVVILYTRSPLRMHWLRPFAVSTGKRHWMRRSESMRFARYVTRKIHWKLAQVAPKTGMFRVCFAWCFFFGLCMRFIFVSSALSVPFRHSFFVCQIFWYFATFSIHRRRPSMNEAVCDVLCAHGTDTNNMI